ncbi:MAG: hypothetical protein ACFE9Q_06225 [Candidatus Hodarchaeota archaeon]
MANRLGFEYNPFLDTYILQFSRFLGDLLNGAWGWSSSLNRGMPVYEMLSEYTIFLHLIIIAIIPLIIGIVYMIKSTHRKLIVFNTLVIVITLGCTFGVYMAFSELFNIRGFGSLLIDAYIYYDHYVIVGCSFIIVIMFVLIPLISNVILSVYKLRLSKSLERDIESNLKNATNA